MSEPYFVWHGIDSRIMRVWVQQYPPIVRPPERYQQITIPGRAGSLTLLEGEDVYEPYLRECKIMPKPGADIYEIMRWLGGTGDVIFGHEPDRKQMARIYDEVRLQKEFANQHSATVRFLCDPFKTSVYEAESVTIDVAGDSYSLQGKGDVISYPLIEVTGIGNCSVFVGNTEIALSDLGTEHEISENESVTEPETATIDCETRKAYKTVWEDLTSHLESIVTHGDFPVLPHDASTLITWSEGVSGLTIYPRWRWF